MNKHFVKMFFIIVAGEAIFMLPFLIPRLYRPLMLEAWGLTNTDIGIAFSAYGITSTVSYMFGGPLADKYHPRHLIALSLALTALASLYLVLSPSSFSFIATYSFFGVSTVLLMWGALIKTTHVVGGEAYRSTSLGVLDGGRGLSAAVVSSALVLGVTLFHPDLSLQTQQIEALNLIYFLTAGFTMILAVAIWISLSGFKLEASQKKTWSLPVALESLKNTKIWLLSIIILSAYCGYKGIDNYSIYLFDIHGLDIKQSSNFTSIIFWLRPFAAVATGILADRFHRNNGEMRFLLMIALLGLSFATQVLLAFSGSSALVYAFVVILSSATFAYGLRAIYFSVFGDLKIETHLIGTTVGIASCVGFLPDIFFGIITGYLIDSHPGVLGYKYTFLFTAACFLAGTIASVALYRLHMKSQPSTNA